MDLLNMIVDFIWENTSECIIAVIIGAVLFLVLREFRCMYWKINDRIDLQQKQYIALQENNDFQEQQIKLLKTIIAKMEQGNSGNVSDALEEAASTEEVDPTDS